MLSLSTELLSHMITISLNHTVKTLSQYCQNICNIHFICFYQVLYSIVRNGSMVDSCRNIIHNIVKIKLNKKYD